MHIYTFKEGEAPIPEMQPEDIEQTMARLDPNAQSVQNAQPKGDG